MKTLLLMTALCFTFAVVGCETTRGVGKDVENTGENIQQGVNATGEMFYNTTNNTTNETGEY